MKKPVKFIIFAAIALIAVCMISIVSWPETIIPPENKINMNIPQWFSLIKDIATIIATVVGSFIAIYGLTTWKKQHTSKAKYEAAKQLLRCVYIMREAIKSVRSPMITSGEMAKANPESNPESPLNKHEAIETLNVYAERWKKISSAAAELSTSALEAEVVIGKEITNYITELYKHISSLSIGIDLYLRHMASPHSEILNTETYETYVRIVHAFPGDDSDTYNNKLEETISKIEGYLKHHLKLK
jgi:hypothetical protein